jgi:outer membrane receptor protein involved in Fe transport
LFGRVLFYKYDALNPDSYNTNLLQSTGWNNSLQSSYTIGSTYLLGPNMVHAFRLAVNRSANHFSNTGKEGTTKLFNWCEAGVKVYCEPTITRINRMSITGGFGLEGGFLTGHKYVGTTYTLNDDLSLVRGAHQMAFGVGLMHGRDNSVSNFASTTHFNFNGSFTGLGMADFLLGRVNTMLAARTNSHHVNGTTLGVFATDSWKATSRLTLNYGIRWEPFIPQMAEAVFNFDYDRFRKGIKSTAFVNAPAGLYYLLAMAPLRSARRTRVGCSRKRPNFCSSVLCPRVRICLGRFS